MAVDHLVPAVDLRPGGCNGDQDAVVVILPETGIARRAQRADHGEWRAADAKHLAYGILIAEQRLDDRFAHDRDPPAGGGVLRGDPAPGIEVPIAEIEILVMHTPNACPRVGVAAHHGLARPELA